MWSAWFLSQKWPFSTWIALTSWCGSGPESAILNLWSCLYTLPFNMEAVFYHQAGVKFSPTSIQRDYLGNWTMNRLNSLQLSVLVYWNSKNTKRLGKQIWWPSYSWDKPSQALHRQQAADERQQPGSPPQYLSTGPYGPSTDNGGSKVAHAWTPHSELKSVSEYYYENIRKTISCLLSYIFLLAGEKKKKKYVTWEGVNIISGPLP